MHPNLRGTVDMKIGFVSMPLAGHLNPMTALARKLRSRGNEIVFFGLPDAEGIVRHAGLNFIPFGEAEYPVGATPAAYAHLAKLKGEDVIRYSFQEMHPRRCQVMLKRLPQKLSAAGIDSLVIDTIHYFVELIPMTLGMPYVHVWNVLPIDTSGATPPCIFGWPYEDTPEAVARNLRGAKTIEAAFAPVLEVGKSWAEQHGLHIDWRKPNPTLSELAVITQTPKEFDFPGIPWPEAFRYTGPFHDDEGRASIPFPWDKLTGPPLIYASLGTLVNGLDHVLRTILHAVAKLPRTQLVLAMGSNANQDDLGPIPSNAIVVPRAPQIELLKRAVLCITHAGINTTLEALTLGVPLVAIPVGFDQPGIGARIAYYGLGESVPIATLSTEGLAAAVQKVLEGQSYRVKARKFQTRIAAIRGLDVAADVIEHAFVSYTVT
jgi:zeaxanthin glucosyltransferase